MDHSSRLPLLLALFFSVPIPVEMSRSFSQPMFGQLVTSFVGKHYIAKDFFFNQSFITANSAWCSFTQHWWESGKIMGEEMRKTFVDSVRY